MTPFGEAQIKQGVVGNDAGWALHFYTFGPGHAIAPTPLITISSKDYYAQIEASLEEGLKGGSYTFTIEGMTDEDYARLASGGRAKFEVAKLYLFWQDANTSAGAYFTNMLGVNAGPSDTELEQSLVAVLKVKKVTRRAGERHYEAVVTAQEVAFALLSTRVETPFKAETFANALDKIKKNTGAEIVVAGRDPSTGLMTPDRAEAAGEELSTFGKGLLYSAAVERIGGAIESALNLYGRKMVLIRNGKVYVGKRQIPLPPDGVPSPVAGGPEPKRLSLATGLLETSPDGEQETDPYASSEVGDTEPKKRRSYRMTLKGRPDLKPGDVVLFDDPTPDLASTVPGIGAAIAGAFAGPFLPGMGDMFEHETLGYVTSVRHTLSRTAGFVTTIAALKIESAGDAAWDSRRPAPSTAVTESPSPSADPAQAAAAQVQRVSRTAREEVRALEIGEVRAVATNAAGAVEPPSQTETVWEGLVASDGRANAARRLPIQRQQPTTLPNVAYATPFAWGKCGLVLPRYPGTRVVLTHRDGRADDPLDIGALWESGHGPVSQPGDWWLSLPVIEGAPTSSVGDAETPHEHTGKVSQDLTDAAGNRWIEVGELTIRVGKDALVDAGTRPSDPADGRGNITIEHTKGGARLVIKQDGSIDIEAGENGTITLKAKKVDVKVKEAMEVGDF